MFAETLTLLYDLLTQPSFTIYKIINNQKQKPAILVWLFSMIILLITAGGGITNLSLSILFLFLFIVTISLFCWAALLHLLATLFGGEGHVRGLLCALPFTFFPISFLVFLPSLFLIFSDTVASLIWSLLFFILCAWSVYLLILVIKENYHLSTLKSILVIITPDILATIFSILLFVVFIFQIAEIFNSNNIVPILQNINPASF